MNKNEENKLRLALEKLEKTTQKIIKTRGYCEDARSLRLLEEIIQEQIGNGSSHRPTRTIR